jgi:anti-sigma-K factor RskA
MRLSPEALEQVAAEHALGTLRGGARRRFAELSRGDPAIGAVARRWELALAGLAADARPVEPPARVWRAIEARLRPAAKTTHVSPWSALGLVSAGLASVLLAALIWLAPASTAEPLFVAVLTAPDAVPRMVVSMPRSGVLRARMVKPWKIAPGQALELWALPKEGAPRSLGLVPNADGDTEIRLAEADRRMLDAKAFAVSLEPAGGSPTGQPTGPVLCSGAIAPTLKT